MGLGLFCVFSASFFLVLERYGIFNVLKYLYIKLIKEKV